MTLQGLRDHLPQAEGKNQISLWVKFSILYYTQRENLDRLIMRTMVGDQQAYDYTIPEKR